MAALRGLFHLRQPSLGVARHLQDRHGWEVLGFATGVTGPAGHERCGEVLDLHAVEHAALAGPLPPDTLERARALECELGVLAADLLSPDRHLGYGWITGGLYHPSALARAPYERHLHLVCETAAAFRVFLERHRPDLVVAPMVGGFQAAVAHAVCARLAVPCWSAAALAYEDLFYWTRDRSVSVPGLAETYEELKRSGARAEPVGIADVTPDTRIVFGPMQAKGRVSSLVAKSWRTSRAHLGARLAGRSLEHGVRLSAKLDYIWKNFRGFRREQRRPYPTLAQLERRRFVYFPLHYEPEATLNGYEPYFTNQLYAVEMLSRAAPADLAIVVKEHPACVGNRPPGWMDTLAGFPRTLLADPFTNAIELVRRAAITATITGTTGLEAAILGRPVISLGPSYRFAFADAVWPVRDVPELRAAIARILSLSDPQRARLVEQGALLDRAVRATCVHLGSSRRLWTEEAAPEDLAALAEMLRARLGTGGPAPATAGA